MKHDRYERLIELGGRRSALKPPGRDRLALIKLERLVSELLDKATLEDMERAWLRMNKVMYLGSLLKLEHNVHRQVGWACKLVLLLDVVYQQESAHFDSGDAIVRLRRMRRYTGLAKYALLASTTTLSASPGLQRHVRLHDDVRRRFASVLHDGSSR